MEGQGLPVELLRVVLHQLLGTQRQDGYRLIRDLERFALVGRSWRDAVFSTPLHLNLDYLPDPKREAVRWLLKATFAELQMHPSFHINRLLTNPDFAARNRWTLQRLWGAQLVGAPARWPQWRHFPNLHALELNCDTMADIEDKSHFFESRVLAPLTQLKHLSLQQFGGADLTRLPLSVVTLHADVDMVLPLVLPPELRLEELTLTTTRLLCDWAQLCKQVTRRAYIEASSIDLYVPQPGPDEGPPACLFRHAADGFKQGAVLEVELVSQEVCLVQLGGGGPLPKHIPEAAYQPDVLESMHLVTLAADFQQHEYRSFGCIYNPDDLQAEEYLGMTDGMTVQLHRHVPGKPQVLGFCYGLAEEQLSYLLSEAEVEGLALEAVEGPDLTRVLNNEEFQRRSGDTLQWLQGVDVLGELDLRAFPQLIRVEGYVLYEPESREAVGRLPPGLTSLDLCAVPEEDDIEGDPGPLTANWPDFVNVTDCPGYPCLAHLTQLRELSLRHFQQVDLLRGIPTSLQTITLECPRPVPLPSTMFFIMRPMPELVGCREPQEQRLPCSCRACMTARCAARHGTWRHAERFHFLLPPLEPGATRTLNIELHQNEDYELRQPMIYLSQFLNLATHVTITLSSDLVSDPADREEEESSGSEGEWEEEGEEWLSEEEEESDDDDSVEEEEEEEEAEGGEEAEDASGAASDPPSPQPALVEPAAAAVAPPAPPPQLGAVRCALVLAAGHGSLREAMEALTASSLQSIEVDAPRVLFIDESGTSCTSSHRMQALIRQHYGNSWLVCSHDAMPPDEAEDEEEYNGGFTMTRK